MGQNRAMMTDKWFIYRQNYWTYTVSLNCLTDAQLRGNIGAKCSPDVDLFKVSLTDIAHAFGFRNTNLQSQYLASSDLGSALPPCFQISAVALMCFQWQEWLKQTPSCTKPEDECSTWRDRHHLWHLRCVSSSAESSFLTSALVCNLELYSRPFLFLFYFIQSLLLLNRRKDPATVK